MSFFGIGNSEKLKEEIKANHEIVDKLRGIVENLHCQLRA